MFRRFSGRKRKKQAEEEERRAPLFFKIIHPKIIQDRQLEIPEKFVKKFGDELSDVAVLKLPRGPEWLVRVKRDRHGTWFHSRWDEFVTYHSISPGHLLVFRYDGESRFYVLIFDMTGGEIDYRSDKIEEPSNINAGLIVAVKQEVVEEDEDYKGKMVVASPSNGGYKSAPVGKQEVLTSSEMPITEPCFQRRNPSIHVEIDAEAFRAAREFKSEHPFFIVPMISSYVRHGCVPIPSTFNRSFLPKRLRYVKIQVSGGTSWEVKCLHTGSKKRTLRLSRGISAFMYDNNIVQGDVCAFELIYKEDVPELSNDISALLIAHVFHRST